MQPDTRCYMSHDTGTIPSKGAKPFPTLQSLGAGAQRSVSSCPIWLDRQVAVNASEKPC
jgi:hypothetical protein